MLFFQAEDGIRDLVRSRGLGDVYKRQALNTAEPRAPIPAVNSSAAGAYIFDDLWPGEYYLVFNMPAGMQWRRTLQNQGANEAIDSDPAETTGRTDDFTLESDEDNEDIDAGYFRIARISDYVWEDNNGNGLQDGGCLLYTSDAADERSSVDLGGRRIIKKTNKTRT